MGVAIPPLYINEIVPSEIQGKLGSLVQFQVTFGIFVSFALCIILPATHPDKHFTNDYWIGIYLFPIIPSLIQIFLFLFVYKYDSPKWLIDSKSEKKLEYLMKTLYVNNWEAYLNKLLEEERKKESLLTKESGKLKDPGFSDLFSIKGYRKALIIACTLSMLQQMTGINSFIFYSSQIFKKIGGDADLTNTFTAILGLCNMGFTMFCLLFIEKYGRKFMLIQGCIGMCLCQGVLFVFEIAKMPIEALYLPVMLVYVGFFESSLGPVLWIYCGETLTDKGIGLAVCVNWLCTGIIGFYGYLIQVVDIGYTFLAFSCISAAAAMFVWIGLVETKGKSKEEIEEIFHGHQILQENLKD